MANDNNGLSTNEKRIEFLTSAFKINTEPGSNDSLNWLKNMKDAKNHEIFYSNLIHLVNYKWEQVSAYIYFEGFVYITYYTYVGIVDSSLFSNQIWSKWISFIFTIIMILFELYQVRSIGWKSYLLKKSEFDNFLFSGEFTVLNITKVMDLSGELLLLWYLIETIFHQNDEHLRADIAHWFGLTIILLGGLVPYF